MKSRIIFAAICAACCLAGAATSQSNQRPPMSKGGRYSVVIAQERGQIAAVLLDTETGATWFRGGGINENTVWEKRVQGGPGEGRP
jgi:hypothetical protein